MALNFHGNGISSKFQNPVFIHTMCTSEKRSFLGAHRMPKIVCIYIIDEIQHWVLLYYSARKKAIAMVFIWGDRRYHAVRFEYKTASERYLFAEI